MTVNFNQMDESDVIKCCNVPIPLNGEWEHSQICGFNEVFFKRFNIPIMEQHGLHGGAVVSAVASH